MYHYLKGKLAEKNPAFIVVDCNGVGYEVQISLTTYERIKDAESIKILTHLIVREDAQILFGFASEMEKQLFLMLISVSGVGPNTARVVLSSMEPEEIVSALVNEDVNRIKSVKGIGPKSAQRLIIELKDKAAELLGAGSAEKIVSSDNNVKNEALAALTALGIAPAQAHKVINKVLKTNDLNNLKVEDLIKLALANL